MLCVTSMVLAGSRADVSFIFDVGASGECHAGMVHVPQQAAALMTCKIGYVL